MNASFLFKFSLYDWCFNIINKKRGCNEGIFIGASFKRKGNSWLAVLDAPTEREDVARTRVKATDLETRNGRKRRILPRLSLYLSMYNRLSYPQFNFQSQRRIILVDFYTYCPQFWIFILFYITFIFIFSLLLLFRVESDKICRHQGTGFARPRIQPAKLYRHYRQWLLLWRSIFFSFNTQLISGKIVNNFFKLSGKWHFLKSV